MVSFRNHGFIVKQGNHRYHYFFFQLRGMIQVESINIGVVHQDKITGITIGRLWDAPVLITYVSLFICIKSGCQ